MKFKKILVTGFNKSALDENIWKKIYSLTDAVVFAPQKDVDCLLAKFNNIDKATIDKFPKLQYIGLLATGSATVDSAYAKSKNIAVCNIPGYATESVAEWVFALILEHLRSGEKAKVAGRKGDYSGDGFTATEIKGKQFGIIGMGRIGTRVAELASAFGANVVYWSRERKKDIETKTIVYKPIDSFISTCDFLSLHVNRTKETEGIVNEKRIGALKKGAIVVNVSPMELVDRAAVMKRLQKGDLTFIFDHPDEMDAKDVLKLAKYPSCIVYPPIGFVTKEARIVKQEIFVSNLENFLKGKPTNKVN